MNKKVHTNIQERPTGVSNTNTYVQTGKTNARYISYAKSMREPITPPMTSPQECVGRNKNPGFPGRYQIM